MGIVFFFFNDTATTEIYTLSLHDALPIWSRPSSGPPPARCRATRSTGGGSAPTRSATPTDRKSTRLNSSHLVISYAVFCLKKKKKKTKNAQKHKNVYTNNNQYAPTQSINT